MTIHHPEIAPILTALLPSRISDDADKAVMDSQRPAAVLFPLIERAGGYTVLLTTRPDTMPSHAGQISFPGGRIERGESALEAALRETHEEVGIKPSEANVIGRLHSFNGGANYRITPFVALIDPRARIIPDPREVADYFEVPLAFLMNPDNHTPRDMHYKGKTYNLIDMPYCGPDGIHRNLWGMTAMIIYRLYRRAYAGDFSHPDGE
ncbi:MAG: CoA pyrophosphatase [Robiginitomaculum sp.]